MTRFDVRRLAAVDMYGTAGTPRRRRVILGEFVAGALACPVIGALAAGAGRLETRVFGWWLIAVGLNYVVLALHAVSLSRPGALDAELAGVDTDAELRRYAVRQAWVAVPLAMPAFALRRWHGRPAQHD